MDKPERWKPVIDFVALPNGVEFKLDGLEFSEGDLFISVLREQLTAVVQRAQLPICGWQSGSRTIMSPL